jgi:hypothetical protein
LLTGVAEIRLGISILIVTITIDHEVKCGSDYCNESLLLLHPIAIPSLPRVSRLGCGTLRESATPLIEDAQFPTIEITPLER